MTLPAIPRNISPIPIGKRPGFLSKGINRHAKNGSNDGERLSAVHSFLMTSAMALHISVELVWNCFVIKTLLHSSASSPDGPAPPLVLTAALFTNCCSFFQHRLHQILLDALVRVHLSVKYLTLLLYSVDVFALNGARFFDLMGGSRSACYQPIVSLHW